MVKSAGSKIPGVVIGGADKKSKMSGRTLVIAGGAVGFLLLLVVIFVGRSYIANASGCNNSKNSPLYKDSAKALQSDPTQQYEMAQKIKKSKNYLKDVNCLYPMLAYSINNNNAKDVTFYGHYFAIESAKLGDSYKLYDGYHLNTTKEVNEAAQSFLKTHSEAGGSFSAF